MPAASNALEILAAQHHEIDEMLAAISGAPEAVEATALAALADRLIIHLAAEQELFYPAVATSVSREVHAELLAEHAEIQRVLATLLWLDHERAAQDAGQKMVGALARLSELVAMHATWQERDLHATVAGTWSADELARLGREIGAWIDGLVVGREAPGPLRPDAPGRRGGSARGVAPSHR